jgi:hypothetical protein
MAETGATRSEVDGSSAARTTAGHRTGWTGWIVFAAIMLLLNGCIQMLQGLMALVNEDYFTTATEDLTVHLPYAAWGWVHLLVGVALFASGLGVLSGNLLARTVGVVLAGVNAFVALLFLDAAPGWGIVVISVDVLVIYALTIHGSEMRNPRL